MFGIVFVKLLVKLFRPASEEAHVFKTEIEVSHFTEELDDVRYFCTNFFES